MMKNDLYLSFFQFFVVKRALFNVEYSNIFLNLENWNKINDFKNAKI